LVSPHGLHGPPFSAPTPMLECPQTGLHNEPLMGAGDPRAGERRWFKVEDIAKSVVSWTCLPPHTTPRSTATTFKSARPSPTHRCRNGAKWWRRRAAAPPKPPQIDTRHGETAPAPRPLHRTPSGAHRVMHNSLPFPELVSAWRTVAGARGPLPCPARMHLRTHTPSRPPAIGRHIRNVWEVPELQEWGRTVQGRGGRSPLKLRMYFFNSID